MKLIYVIVYFFVMKHPDEGARSLLRCYKYFHLAFSLFEIHVVTSSSNTI